MSKAAASQELFPCYLHGKIVTRTPDHNFAKAQYVIYWTRSGSMLMGAREFVKLQETWRRYRHREEPPAEDKILNNSKRAPGRRGEI
jgi:hypothetical protein